MPTADEIRESQRATWAALSAGWAKWETVITEQLRPVGDAIIGRLEIAKDQHHLDIASGTGEPGLSVAARAPSGRIVLTDLAPEMLRHAADRAAALGLRNVETRACSADALPFPDGCFDSISVRFGYMFFPDLSLATAEFVRVLKPGGRLCASVWVDPEHNPWTSIAMNAIATEVAIPAPPPGSPSMFRCAAPGHISALYEAAGLRNVAEWDVPVELVTTSASEYWQVVSEHTSVAVAALARTDPAARQRIADLAIDDVRRYERADGHVHVPGLARCIIGTRPGS